MKVYKVLILFFLFVHSAVYTKQKYRIAILPFKGYGEKAVLYKYLSTLIRSSLYFSTIKEYKYEYVKLANMEKDLREYFPEGLNLNDYGSFKRILDDEDLDFIIAGIYMVGKRNSLSIKVLLFGQGGKVKKIFFDRGDIGPLMFEVIDRIGEKLVLELKNFLPERSKEEKREIAKKVEKLKADVLSRIYKEPKEFSRGSSKPYEMVYMWIGYPVMVSFSDNPDYFKIGELFPFDKTLGLFDFSMGYYTTRVVRRFLGIDRIITGGDIGFTLGVTRANYYSTDYSVSVYNVISDLSLYLGYMFSFKSFSVFPFLGGGIGYQVAREEVVVLKGVSPFASFGVMVEFSIGSLWHIIFGLNSRFYFYKKQNLLSNCINIGVSRDIKVF